MKWLVIIAMGLGAWYLWKQSQDKPKTPAPSTGVLGGWVPFIQPPVTSNTGTSWWDKLQQNKWPWEA